MTVVTSHHVVRSSHFSVQNCIEQRSFRIQMPWFQAAFLLLFSITSSDAKQKQIEREENISQFLGCSSSDANTTRIDNPLCACRFSSHWNSSACQEWFNSPDIKKNLIKSNRIINGTPVPAGSYPWFARPLETDGSWGQCGGKCNERNNTKRYYLSLRST